MRDVALAAWVLAVVVLVGLWLGVSLLSDAVPTVPTLRDVDVAPFLPRPTGGSVARQATDPAGGQRPLV